MVVRWGWYPIQSLIMVKNTSGGSKTKSFARKLQHEVPSVSLRRSVNAKPAVAKEQMIRETTSGESHRKRNERALGPGTKRVLSVTICGDAAAAMRAHM